MFKAVNTITDNMVNDNSDTSTKLIKQCDFETEITQDGSGFTSYSFEILLSKLDQLQTLNSFLC